MSSIVEMSNVNGFNASVQVTELLMKTLENAARELASRCINESAIRHGFNADEEIRALGLENLALIRKQMAKKSAGEKKEKKTKEPKAPKEKKVVFPMPFIAELVDVTGCQGLAYNRGLFTQCSKKCMENGNFCKGCQSEADKNATGQPDCGTVGQRLATGLYEFKDPKGRSPVSYLKVLEKLKLTPEAALEEATKLYVEIPNIHLTVIAKETKTSAAAGTRGRPKKTGAIKANNVSDLFAQVQAEGEETEVVEGEEKPAKASKKAKLSDEEKALKKAALEAQRAAAKVEREAKLAAEKAEKEAKRKAEAEQKKAEREAKRAQEKAEREAKKAAEKEAAKANKGKKAAAAPAEPAVAVAPAEPAVAVAPAPVAVAPAPVAPVAAPAAKVSVTRMQISGKAYLRSNNNILYDPATKEEVGLWDEETKTIKELPQEEEEEEEQEEEEEEYIDY